MWCYMYIHNICYDSNIFQEFWVNLLVFLKQKTCLLIIILPLDKIIEFFSHIRSLGAAGALAVDICICFHDTES